MVVEYRHDELVSQLLKRWWVIVVSVMLGLAVALVALEITPATYETTATQLVKGKPGTGAGSDYAAAQYAEARATSYPEFIHSEPVLAGVRDVMGVEFSDERLRTLLSAANRPGTPLVRITAEGSSPEEARGLADAAAEHLARFIEQIETVGGRSPVTVETAVRAALPADPSSPSRALYLAMGVSGGAALGVMLILLWGALARRSDTGVESTAAARQ